MENYRTVRPEDITPAHHELALSIMPEIRKIARYHSRNRPQVTQSDLVNEGYLGALDAAVRYNPAFGIRFDIFAGKRVSGSIVDSLRRGVGPIHTRRLRRKLDTICTELREQGIEPTSDQIAAKLGMPPKMFRLLELRMQNYVELDSQKSLSDTHPLRPRQLYVNQEEALLVKEKRKLVAKILSGGLLSPRERLVIKLFFFRDMKPKQIAPILGRDESRVSRILHAAMKKLKSDQTLQQLVN